MAKHIADEYGILEAPKAAMDAKFVGQKGHSPEEVAYLLDDAALHDD